MAKTFPSIVGKLFYFSGYNGSNPVFEDKNSALAFREKNKDLIGIEPKEGCILSYNMGDVILDKSDYHGEILQNFKVVGAVAYFVRSQPLTSAEFFASEIDIARYVMFRDKNNVEINANFKIVPILKLDDIGSIN